MCKSIPRTLYTTLLNVNDTTDEDKMANKTVTMSLLLENDIALSKSRNSTPLIHPDVNVAGNGSHATLYAVGRFESIDSRT